MDDLSRWGALYLLVFLFIVACIWENSLAILPIDHTLLLIAFLIFFGILLNIWNTNHETNLLVSQTYKKQSEAKLKESEPTQIEEARLEKSK